ncbi:MAG: hypothetical protein IJ382_08355 [Flavobacteriales bacterium]|nr:hypothetical protein [Flavobacteriales bacterium]
MKKLLLLFTLVFSINIIGAQNTHLTFKGIPIDGNVNDFAAGLSKKGFTQIRDLEDNSILLEGRFADFDAVIGLKATPKSKTIWKVVVFIDKKYTSWGSIKTDFEKYKELYIKKYGKPSDDFHFFVPPYYEGDGHEMQALALDKCTYAAFFELPEGPISLQMKDGFIVFGYEDGINAKIMVSESEQSMLNDI